MFYIVTHHDNFYCDTTKWTLQLGAKIVKGFKRKKINGKDYKLGQLMTDTTLGKVPLYNTPMFRQMDW